MPNWSKLSWSTLSREEQRARLSELIRDKLRTPPATSVAAAARVRSSSSGGSTQKRP
jgi:hypothetical protein